MELGWSTIRAEIMFWSEWLTAKGSVEKLAPDAEIKVNPLLEAMNKDWPTEEMVDATKKDPMPTGPLLVTEAHR